MEIDLGNLLSMVVWALVAGICVGASTGITVRIFDLFTPNLDEIDELRKGNVAVAIVLAACILSTGVAIGFAIHQP